MSLSAPIVCVVTRVRGVEGSPERRALLDRLGAAAAAGASLIQVRERQLSDRALLLFVRDLVAQTGGTACQVLVNDRPDIAIASGAAGVHLKDQSFSVADVRRIAPSPFLVGRSVHSEDRCGGGRGRRWLRLPPLRHRVPVRQQA